MLRLPHLLAAAALATAASAATAATISFDGFPDFGEIDQSLGDVAGQVDVSYTLTGGLTPQTWRAGYNGGDGDDLGVVMASTSTGQDTLVVTLTGLGGYTFASYGAAIGRQVSFLDTIATLRIYADGSLLFERTDDPSAGWLIGVSGGLADASVLRFELTGDWNVGFQSISYNVPSAPPVPLPAAGGLLVAAMAGLGALAARRRRRG